MDRPRDTIFRSTIARNGIKGSASNRFGATPIPRHHANECRGRITVPHRTTSALDPPAEHSVVARHRTHHRHTRTGPAGKVISARAGRRPPGRKIGSTSAPPVLLGGCEPGWILGLIGSSALPIGPSARVPPNPPAQHRSLPDGMLGHQFTHITLLPDNLLGAPNVTALEATIQFHRQAPAHPAPYRSTIACTAKRRVTAARGRCRGIRE